MFNIIFPFQLTQALMTFYHLHGIESKKLHTGYLLNHPGSVRFLLVGKSDIEISYLNYI